MNTVIFIRFFFFIFLLHACSNEKSTDVILNPFSFKSFSENNIEIVSTQNTKAINISNFYGGVTVNGWSYSDSIRIFSIKTIKSVNRETAAGHFGEMNILQSIENDTFQLAITAPRDTDSLKYHFSISVEIPYNMACRVPRCEGNLFVNQLNATLLIHHSKNNVLIENQTGSCAVTSAMAQSVSIALSEAGFCKLTSDLGDINLTIPVTTSAALTAKSDFGLVGYRNLSINNLVQQSDFFSGILNNGTAEINLRSTQGNIFISGL